MGNATVKSIDSSHIETWLRERIAIIVGMPASNIQNSDDFESFGIDSAQAVTIMMDLENWLELPDELPLELLFEEKSIQSAALAIALAADNMLQDNDITDEPV